MNAARVLLPLTFLFACSAPKIEIPVAEEPTSQATSLLGDELEPPDLKAERQAAMEAELEDALAKLNKKPKGEMEHVWVGRRLAYLGRYREALEVYDRGLELHPKSYRLLRHRGHRWITLREFDRAIGDLGLAAKLIQGVKDEFEPDGQPNERNLPTSTTHSNIYYHLGLAYYLQGNYERALSTFRECVKYSRASDDMTVANAYWLHQTLHRLDRRDDLRLLLRSIRPDMDIIENHAYHDLLVYFKGEFTGSNLLEGVAKDDVAYPTIAYGLAAWTFNSGRKQEGREQFEHIVAETNWSAFGHIAAEAELARGI